jgi:hypothetical protein
VITVWPQRVFVNYPQTARQYSIACPTSASNAFLDVELTVDRVSHAPSSAVDANVKRTAHSLYTSPVFPRYLRIANETITLCSQSSLARDARTITSGGAGCTSRGPTHVLSFSSHTPGPHNQHISLSSQLPYHERCFLQQTTCRRNYLQQATDKDQVEPAWPAKRTRWPLAPYFRDAFGLRLLRRPARACARSVRSITRDLLDTWYRRASNLRQALNDLTCAGGTSNAMATMMTRVRHSSERWSAPFPLRSQ